MGDTGADQIESLSRPSDPRRRRPLTSTEKRATIEAAGLTLIGPLPNGALDNFTARHRCGRNVTHRLNSLRSGRPACHWCAADARHQHLDRALVDRQAQYVRELLDIGLVPIGRLPLTVRTSVLCVCATCGRTVASTLRSVREHRSRSHLHS